jgi:biopolymer transport protein ExbD
MRLAILLLSASLVSFEVALGLWLFRTRTAAVATRRRLCLVAVLSPIALGLLLVLSTHFSRAEPFWAYSSSPAEKQTALASQFEPRLLEPTCPSLQLGALGLLALGLAGIVGAAALLVHARRVRPYAGLAPLACAAMACLSVLTGLAFWSVDASNRAGELVALPGWLDSAAWTVIGLTALGAANILRAQPRRPRLERMAVAACLMVAALGGLAFAFTRAHAQDAGPGLALLLEASQEGEGELHTFESALLGDLSTCALQERPSPWRDIRLPESKSLSEYRQAMQIQLSSEGLRRIEERNEQAYPALLADRALPYEKVFAALRDVATSHKKGFQLVALGPKRSRWARAPVVIIPVEFLAIHQVPSVQEVEGGILLTVALGADGFQWRVSGELPAEALEGFQGAIPATHDGLDFQALNELAFRLQRRFPRSNTVLILPEPNMPYGQVVAALDALREKLVGHELDVRERMFTRAILARGPE